MWLNRRSIIGILFTEISLRFAAKPRNQMEISLIGVKMKITVVCDAFFADDDFAAGVQELVEKLGKRGHEAVTVCLDETERDREGSLIVPGLRPVGNSELENAVWDSDTVLVMTPDRLGRAAMRLCQSHRIPVAAVFSLKRGIVSFRKFSAHSLHSDMMALRHFYDGYLQYADAVLYPSKVAQDAFEAAVDVQTQGFVPEDGSAEKMLDCVEGMLNAIHI